MKKFSAFMQRLAFVLAYPFLWLISILPFKVFYFIADIVYGIVYYIVRYRRNVVDHNLSLVFPDKSADELKRIRKKFYKHFCDLFMEMIKTLSISDKELKKRFIIKNPEEIKHLESLQKSYLIMCGHYASYEWLVALHFYGLTYKGYGVYKKLKNPYFDKLIVKIRSRFNTIMLPSNVVPKQIAENKIKGVLSSYGIIADQSPRLKNAKYIRNFLGHKVPVFIGPEIIAKRYDLSVSYLHIEKVSRGHYEAKFITITHNPKNEEPHTITDRYFELLEAQIKKQPTYYLWTHKRWKHSKNLA